MPAWKRPTFWVTLREDRHKKVCFLVVRPLRFYPPYTNCLVVHGTFFCVCYNSLKRILTILSFLPNFWAKTVGFYRNKVFFCLVVRGVYPAYTLCGPITKKHTFLCLSSLIVTQKVGLFQADICLALNSYFLLESLSLANI